MLNTGFGMKVARVLFNQEIRDKFEIEECGMKKQANHGYKLK